MKLPLLFSVVQDLHMVICWSNVRFCGLQYFLSEVIQMHLYDEIPDMLSSALSNPLEHIVFFFGAGISSSLSNKRYGWTQWVRDGIALLPEEDMRLAFYGQLGDTPTAKGDPDAGTLTAVLEGVIDALKKTPGLYDAWMHEAFETAAVENPALAATLKKLLILPDVFVTTNYDGLLEQATGAGAVSYLHPEIVFPMLEAGRNDRVVHIHGRYSTHEGDTEDSIIATDTQYRQLLSDEGAQFIQNTIGTRTIIFVGCGKTTSDPNISRFISFAKKYLHLEKTSYFLHLSGEVPDDLPEHVVPVCYGGKYDDLPDFLEQLAENRLDAFVQNHSFIELFPCAITSEQRSSFSQYYFAAEDLSFQGRETELVCLEEFLEQRDQNLWYSVNGQSGSGKSRLALELCRRNGGQWCSFFVDPEAGAAALDTFVPYRDTLVVFDDFKGVERNAAVLIEKMFALFAGTGCRLRLLLCERESSTLSGTWFEELERSFSKGFLPKFRSVRYGGAERPFLVLGDLDGEAVLRMIAEICAKNGLPADNIRDKKLRDAYGGKLEKLQFRPLFLQMFVESWIENGCSSTRFDGYVQLLEGILGREQDRWLQELGGDYRLFDSWIRLLLLAIIKGKITRADVPEKYAPDFDAILAYVRAHSFPGKQRQARFISLVADMCHNIDQEDAYIEPMYPDILKEYCFLYYLDEDRITEAAGDLWSFDPEGFSLWMEKIVTDFPYHDKAYELIDGDASYRFRVETLKARVHLLDNSTLQKGDDLEAIHAWVDREYEFWHGMALEDDGSDEKKTILILIGLDKVAQQYGAQDAPWKHTVDKMLAVFDEALALKGGEALDMVKMVMSQGMAKRLSIAGMSGHASELLAKVNAAMKTSLGRETAQETYLEQLNTEMMRHIFSEPEDFPAAYEVLKRALAHTKELRTLSSLTYFLKMCAHMGNLAVRLEREKFIGRAEYLAEQTRGLLEEDAEAYFARLSLRLNRFEADIFQGRTTDHRKEVQEIFQAAWKTPGIESNECLSRAGILLMNWVHDEGEIMDIREKLRSRLDEARGEEENGDFLAQAYLRCTHALKKATGNALFSKEEIDDAYAVMLRYPESENTRAAFQEMLEYSTEAGKPRYLRREVLTAAATYDRYHPDPDEWLDDPEDFLYDSPEEPYRRAHRKVGANEPCPCGSGKKFKKCCKGTGKYD